ncbi:hypothetical protein C0991_002556 [Blastosporella zonata]|nr:hypothetical protein C0991_002556 [Blastosporella zonata]
MKEIKREIALEQKELTGSIRDVKLSLEGIVQAPAVSLTNALPVPTESMVDYSSINKHVGRTAKVKSEPIKHEAIAESEVSLQNRHKKQSQSLSKSDTADTAVFSDPEKVARLTAPQPAQHCANTVESTTTTTQSSMTKATEATNTTGVTATVLPPSFTSPVAACDPNAAVVPTATAMLNISLANQLTSATQTTPTTAPDSSTLAITKPSK